MNEVEALKELLVQRLDGQDRILTRIEAQTTKTNGRVSFLERAWARIAVQIKAHGREIGELKGIKPTPIVKGYTPRDVTIFLAGGASLIAAYKFIAWLIQEMAKR